MTDATVVRNLNVHYLSLSVDWPTPAWLYAQLNDEFDFDFDPCPLYGADGDFDGLAIEWGQSNYVNPPYGRAIGQWTRKARDEATGGEDSGDAYS
jgi:hypothetical protein